jgi:spore maturation protein CgeB
MKKSNALKAIEKIANGNSQTKRKILELFISQTTKELIDIDTCILTNEWIELKKITHKLHASFLYFNMKEPIRLVEKLTDTAGKEITTTNKQVNELKNICVQLINEFTIELKK